MRILGWCVLAVISFLLIPSLAGVISGGLGAIFFSFYFTNIFSYELFPAFLFSLFSIIVFSLIDKNGPPKKAEGEFCDKFGNVPGFKKPDDFTKSIEDDLGIDIFKSLAYGVNALYTNHRDILNFLQYQLH